MTYAELLKEAVQKIEELSEEIEQLKAGRLNENYNKEES